MTPDCPLFAHWRQSLCVANVPLADEVYFDTRYSFSYTLNPPLDIAVSLNRTLPVKKWQQLLELH
jgi:hypothetical protein